MKTIFIKCVAKTAIILYIFAEQCIGIISNDAEIVSTGSIILRMQCFTLPLMASFAVSSMFMQNIGNYFSALLISVSRQGLFYIPLLYILPALYGKTGIYLLQPVSDFLSFILAVAVVYRRYGKNVLHNKACDLLSISGARLH